MKTLRLQYLSCMLPALLLTLTAQAQLWGLDMQMSGDGDGSVNGAGIACNFTDGVRYGDCFELYAFGTPVTLTATAELGSSFVSFTGGGCSTSPCTLTSNSLGTVTVDAEFGADNSTPVASAGGPYSGEEGSAVALSGATATDDDTGDVLAFSWTVDVPATCSFSDDTALNPDLTCDDNGSFSVTLTADDGTDTHSDETTVTVANVAPTVGAVTVPLDPININDMPVTGVTATYTDPGAADTHSCTVDYDDGAGPLGGMAATGTCTGPNHSYGEAGVYTVTVEITDDDGGSGSAGAETMIVIYDPTGGFVSGGGWIESPEGACPDFCDSATGRANFGFVSRYKNGASTPTGTTQFRFRAGDLAFNSDTYDWLVIAGPNAKYKGDGTINGSGNYRFMLTATDGAVNGGGGVDKFRIKIWETGTSETIVYDNKMGSDDDGFDGTVVGGGNIKVHKGGSAKATDEVASRPETFALYDSYPNPFNPSVTIRFDLPIDAEATLRIYDVVGRQVTTLVDQSLSAASHSVTWNAERIASGIYFYRLQAGDYVETKRMVIVK